jgi:hypothetical protein
MVKETTEASRFNWRLQLCAAFVAFVFSVAIAVCQRDTALFLHLFVVGPFLVLISVLLLVYATIRKGRPKRLQLLSMLAILWAISTSLFVYEIKHPVAIRSAARWLVWSHQYKDEVLAQPTSANGDLKHIEWDGWGMFGQDTSVFLVFDPTDTLSTPALHHQSGKFNGIPCEVPVVSRLEKHWYAVLFYTNQYWGQCNYNEQARSRASE